MFNSVRVRLTLWYVLVLSLLLAGFSIFIYTAFSNSLYTRLDNSISNAAEAMVSFFLVEMDENGGDADAGAVEALEELQLPNVYVAIFEEDRLLASTYPENLKAVMPESLLSQIKVNVRPAFATVAIAEGEEARLAAVAVKAGGKDYFIVIVEPLSETVAQLESLKRVFYIGLPATLILAGLAGFLLARKSLAPVVVMSNQAGHISAHNLHERLKVTNPHDEIGHLAIVFNELLSRLDHSFENMRAFMADASHELRTPLAIIRGEADVALSQDRDPAEYRESLAIIQDEAGRLSHIVEDMFALARADARQRPLRVEEFYLNDLVEECFRAAQILALSKAVSLTLDPVQDVTFHGDEDLLRRMLLNLLDNAIKYTPSGGAVSIKLLVEASSVQIVVSDTGIGIPAEHVGQVFERFYRVDRARTRAEGGTGLGLSIARWAAEAHRGSINLTSEPGRGSTFTVSLPR
ncbi:MAG: ATP-binding protein [Blastocatellia bacterium]|nr:ATP-binding protein [Blastocatellia bacterium]